MKKISLFLYMVCFLLMHSLDGKSQAFNHSRDNNSYTPTEHLPPPTVGTDSKDAYNFNSRSNSSIFDDDPNNDGVGLGEVKEVFVGEGILIIILFAITYCIIKALYHRNIARKKRRIYYTSGKPNSQEKIVIPKTKLRT